MIRVKICGLTSPGEALSAAEAGADFIGLVFWPKSPRCVGVETARAIAGALPPSILKVGVFVNAPAEVLERTAEEVGLDILQLHGEEPPDALLGLRQRVWKAVRVGRGFLPAEALRYEGLAAGILLDTKVPGEDAPYGGTGEGFDWSLVKQVRRGASFIVLAGGLTPDNVASAIAQVGPDAVDVSTGVEVSPGRKDPAKVRAFIEAARSA
jgi:phosphoribosylanthranilate isomerase